MVITIIIIIMPKIQFLLHMRKKDLFLLPTPTEVPFNTTNSPRFCSSENPSQPNHSSLLRTTNCGILLNHRNLAFYLYCPHWFLTGGSSYQNLRANPFFLLSGSDPPIDKLEFWLPAHWTLIYLHLILQKVHDFRRTDGLAFCPRGSPAGTSVVESCRANL